MNAVEVRGLRKTYGRITALEGLDLDVPTGAVFGLLGPNGAGKSTTFGILCGWLGATSGTARVLGEPSHTLARLRGRVAALPQDARFPDAVTLERQLAHYARLGGMESASIAREVDRVLELVGLSSARRQRGNELSHGMAKRAGIAQALIGSPDVIFLDEPTAGLDPSNARAVRDLIASAAPSATVVVSSHNLAEIQDICTHGAILDHGRLVANGPIADLTRQGEEVFITIGNTAPLPLAELEKRFGATSVDASEPGRLRIRFPVDTDPATVVRAALSLLFDADVPVYEVTRGTSLERAFLELTRSGP